MAGTMIYKKMFGIVLFLIFFSATAGLAADCPELYPLLEKYYSSSQEENIDDYMSTIDQDYVNSLAENYEDYVLSAWTVYDTVDYELSVYNCKVDDADAILYYNVKSTLKTDEGSTDLQRNYFAVFSKPNNEWKIKFVMDEEFFDQQVADLYNYAFLESTDEIISSAINDANELIEYSETIDETESDSEATISDVDKGFNWWWILFIIIILAVLFVMVKRHKPSPKKEKEDKTDKKSEKGKDMKKLLLDKTKLTWAWIKKTVKKYAPILWAFIKKCCIALGKLLKKLFLEIKSIINKKLDENKAKSAHKKKK